MDAPETQKYVLTIRDGYQRNYTENFALKLTNGETLKIKVQYPQVSEALVAQYAGMVQSTGLPISAGATLSGSDTVVTIGYALENVTFVPLEEGVAGGIHCYSLAG